MRWAKLAAAFTLFATPAFSDVLTNSIRSRAAEIIADADAIDALTPPPVNVGCAIQSPDHNRVYQQNGVGQASFTVQWRGTAQLARLKLNGSTVAEAADGKFTNIAAGWYQIAAANSGTECDQVNVGIGDVFVVTGQSNAGGFLSTGQSLVMASRPGLCTLSNYNGQYINDQLPGKYIDAGVQQSIYSLGWIHLCNIRDRAYPTMFVNVARGSTSTFNWYTTEWTRGYLAQALWEHRPLAELWVQGENDDTNTPSSLSFAYMDLLTNQLWQTTIATPRFIALLSWPANPSATIRIAQQQIIDKWSQSANGNMVRPGPDIDLVRTSTTDVHGINLPAFGQAWANALAAHGF